MQARLYFLIWPEDPMRTRSQADFLNHVAVQLQAQGRSQESLKVFQQAVEAYRAVADRKGEGRCLNGVGALYKDLGDPQNAIICLEQALPIRRQTSDRLGEAITLMTLGPVYQRLGRPQAARDCLTEALQISRDLGQRKLEGLALYNQAEVVRMAGQPGRALPLLSQALAIAREEGSSLETGKCVNALACTCSELGKKREALSYCYESLRVFKMIGNAPGQSAALHNIGFFLLGTDLEKHSRAYFEKAVAMDMEMNALGQAALTMSCLADTYLKDDLSRAREFAERSLAVAREVGDKNIVCEALGSLCRVLVEEGEPLAALEIIDEAIMLAKETGSHHQEGGLSHMMALALYRAGACETAFAKFEEAIGILEEHYAELNAENLRLSYFNGCTIQTVYYQYISKLVEYSQGCGDKSYAAKAFYTSERRHARSLREFLQAKLLRGTDDCAEPQDHLGAQAAGPRESPTGIRVARALTVKEVQEGLLDENTVLLEYSLHHELSYLWVLTNSDYAVISLPMGGEEIRERVYQLRQALGSASESCVQLAHELYGALIRPAERWLQGGKHLLIIPDNALHLLPFQILVRDLSEPVGGQMTEQVGESQSRTLRLDRLLGAERWRNRDVQYLIGKHCITYAPSAGICEALGADRPGRVTGRKDLIAFAPVEFGVGERGAQPLKALPGTLREVDSIAALFASDRVVVRKFEEATKRNVVSERLKEFRFVHFATHGFTNDDELEESAIVLASESEGDRLLQTGDITNLDLDADLVVLSACETALGTVKAGEGVLGLVRAFFCAGARSVCASMWKVDDVATAVLMVSFYRKLMTGGFSKAEALRAAQLELVATGRWSSPRFWASFVLAGASK